MLLYLLSLLYCDVLMMVVIDQSGLSVDNSILFLIVKII